jgi:hypothetical protein
LSMCPCKKHFLVEVREHVIPTDFLPVEAI